MNAPPAQAVDLLLESMPLLRAGAAVVLTLKNTYPKPAEWREAVERELGRLRQVADDVRTIQLFANTSRETTVLARVSAARVDATAA